VGEATIAVRWPLAGQIEQGGLEHGEWNTYTF